jgi:hypothetical protein
MDPKSLIISQVSPGRRHRGGSECRGERAALGVVLG